jgi:hypothetical protein
MPATFHPAQNRRSPPSANIHATLRWDHACPPPPTSAKSPFALPTPAPPRPRPSASPLHPPHHHLPPRMQLPILLGGATRHEVTGEPALRDATAHFFHLIRSTRSFATGGSTHGEVWGTPRQLGGTLGPPPVGTEHQVG